jgi:hypothetical protein
LTPLADKAEILNLAKIWRHLQKKAAAQSLDR